MGSGTPPVPAERQLYPSGSRPSTAAGIIPGARTPATPRKEAKAHGSGRETSAVQEPGLKDYQLGECLGKGAFGSVYKALNWGTGEAVAVKQIKLANLPKSELRMIESEIELLKNLHHANIVKYIGFVRSADCLNIILEYCENGSLHSICKAYGKFPENLVGVYMTQVLQGLHYLHDQGVIHRDIKGANILTTKDGTVKLADFGVSTSTLAGGGQDKEAQVVGTPYWMAPEIIQLSGATPASDIWSVGCTVIELLQGRPPYHHLAPMPALFAIVNDDHPPPPEGISAAPRDFLMQCFQKDPNLRVTARKLLRHPWIVGCRRSDAPVSKAPSNFTQAVEEVKQWNQALKHSETSLRTSTGSDGGSPMTPSSSFPQAHGVAGGRGRENGEAREAREARDGRGHQATHAAHAAHAAHATHATHATHAKGGSPLTLAKPWVIAEAFRSPELADDDNWDNDFATAISPSALQLAHLKPQDNFGGLLSSDRLKSFASISDGRNGQSPSTRHEDETEGDLLTIRPYPRKKSVDLAAKTQAQPKASGGGSKPSATTLQSSSSAGGTSNMRPKGAGKSHFGARFELPQRPDVLYREQSTEDYSDLFVDSDSILKRGLDIAATRKNSRHQSNSPQLFHPSDLTNLPGPTQSATAVTTVTTGGSARRQSAPRPSVAPDRPMRRARSSIEIQRFAEDEADEDFSDIVFGGPSVAVSRTDGDGDSDGGESEDGVGGLMLMSKVSSHSWLGDDEDEPDPFASMDPGWDEMDLEANIARDRHARLCERVEGLVRSLKTTEAEDTLSELAEDMLALLCDHADVKDLIIGAHGLLPILEILEPCTVKSRPHMVLSLLKVVNAIILDDVEIQENLCFVGGIPIVTKFAARQYSDEVRLQAAAFVRQMYQTSTLTLQMFVSAGGLNVLVGFLDEDYDAARDLVLIGVNGVWNVFELQGPTPKNDFCRIFSRSKILYPLALVLHRVLDEDGADEIRGLVEGRIVSIFYLFSQAENYVKEVVADRQVLKSVLKDLRRMTAVHQVTMLRFIKNLSMLSTTLESLHSADAIDLLIDLLTYSMRKGGSAQRHFREISNQVLNTLFNLCRLSKERQEDAAVSGIVPLLLRIMRTDHPPKEFALPILCDMAHSGSKGRRHLWQNKGLDFYVSLLSDQYWQVTAIDAILVWLQEETANVEGHLLADGGGGFTDAVAGCLAASRIHALDLNLLEPLNKLLRLSPSIAATLARPELLAGVAQRLPHKNTVVRLNLLRLVRIILDACGPTGGGGLPSAAAQTQARSLMGVIRTLADGDPAVLVRNLAQELVRTHGVGAGGETKAGGGAEAGPAPTSASSSMSLSSSASSSVSSSSSRRPGSSSRRPPLMLHAASVSVPSTPTQGPSGLHRPSNSSAAVAAGLGIGGVGSYFEAAPVTSAAAAAAAAASPRRNAAGPVYRPRSREGPPTAIPRRVSGDATGSGSGIGSGSGSGNSGRGNSRLPWNPSSLLSSSSSRAGGSLSSGIGMGMGPAGVGAGAGAGAGTSAGMSGAAGALNAAGEHSGLGRSESSLSNKENHPVRASRSGSSSGTPGATGSGNKKRPPSSGAKR